MGRIEVPREQFSVYLYPRVHARLRRRADQAGVRISALIERYCEEGMIRDQLEANEQAIIAAATEGMTPDA
jgi:hypothetical protein